MLVDIDLAFGETAAELRRLDLENQVIPPHGIIASDGSLFFDGEDKLEVSASVRDKGRAFLGCRLDERLAVPGQERFEDITIGIGNGSDAVKF